MGAFVCLSAVYVSELTGWSPLPLPWIPGIRGREGESISWPGLRGTVLN